MRDIDDVRSAGDTLRSPKPQGSPGTITCTATGTDAMGGTEWVVIPVLIGNTPPVILSAPLRPGLHRQPTHGVCGHDDADGDIVTETYTWYVRRIPATVPSGGLDGALHFDKGDGVYVVVTPTNGTDEGASNRVRDMTVSTSTSAPDVRSEGGHRTGGWSNRMMDSSFRYSVGPSRGPQHWTTARPWAAPWPLSKRSRQ